MHIGCMVYGMQVHYRRLARKKKGKNCTRPKKLSYQSHLIFLIFLISHLFNLQRYPPILFFIVTFFFTFLFLYFTHNNYKENV